jgi:capsular exopolysaccharide synthesis family protein
MSDKRIKRRNRLLSDTKVIDSAEAGADPDVEVFALDDGDPQPPRSRPRSQNRLEQARTTEWSSKDLRAELPAALQRSKQVTGSIEVAAESAGPEVPPHAEAAATQPAQETGRFRRADSALIHAGSPVTGPPPEDPLESTPTDPRGSTFIEAYPTDPVIEQGYFEELQDEVQRPRLEAPLQIKVQTVERISPDPRLRVITASSSEAAEQYRVLSLKLKEGRSIRRVVAVTAPTSESGGPILATNLALALAEGRRTRIALVDADLRAGRLAELFDLTQGPGLTDQLRSHRRSPEQPWTLLSVTGGLHLIPAGPPVKNPASLLNAEVLGDLIAELRRSYDFIIVCTPPVTESADVNILQEHVDGAILVVRAGVTRKESVSASIARLGTRKFIGAVLCGV